MMERFEILSNEMIYPEVFLLRLRGDIGAAPGTFSMLETAKGVDPLLLRPLSISDCKKDEFSFLYERKGKGTKCLSERRKGEDVGVLNNLGHGFNIPKKGRCAIVAGGLGIAPMPLIAKSIGRKEDIALIAGFRDRSFYIDEIAPYVSRVLIATESGLEGEKGFVTEVLNPHDYDYVLTCGPIPMMRAVYEKCKGICEVQVSLESRMACGVGACLGCAIKTSLGMKRVCKDGPVFPGEVIF